MSGFGSMGKLKTGHEGSIVAPLKTIQIRGGVQPAWESWRVDLSAIQNTGRAGLCACRAQTLDLSVER